MLKTLTKKLDRWIKRHGDSTVMEPKNILLYKASNAIKKH